LIVPQDGQNFLPLRSAPQVLQRDKDGSTGSATRSSGGSVGADSLTSETAAFGDRLSVPQDGQKLLPLRSAPQALQAFGLIVIFSATKELPHLAQNLRLGAFSV
jgi:hypothetical protein